MSENRLDRVGHLERSIDWMQGLAIALGVPFGPGPTSKASGDPAVSKRRSLVAQQVRTAR